MEKCNHVPSVVGDNCPKCKTGSYAGSPHKVTIEFEVGDRVYCSYYNVTGIITKIAPDPNYSPLRSDNEKNIITILKDDTKDHYVYTKVMIKSANSKLPNYLRMICKKADAIPIKPKEVITLDPMVRAVNLSSGLEYSFSHDIDPAYAVYYAWADDNGKLDVTFEYLHAGFTDWANLVEEGTRTYSKGDWCALKPNK